MEGDEEERGKERRKEGGCEGKDRGRDTKNEDRRRIGKDRKERMTGRRKGKGK